MADLIININLDESRKTFLVPLKKEEEFPVAALIFRKVGVAGNKMAGQGFFPRENGFDIHGKTAFFQQIIGKRKDSFEGIAVFGKKPAIQDRVGLRPFVDGKGQADLVVHPEEGRGCPVPAVEAAAAFGLEKPGHVAPAETRLGVSREDEAGTLPRPPLVPHSASDKVD